MQTTKLTDEQQALRDVARDVFLKQSTPARVRQLADDPAGYDRQLWEQAGELGFLGLDVPEALGGSGQTFLETALVLEEVGRTVTPGPYLSHSLAIGAFLAAVDSALARQWLPKLATGAAVGGMCLGSLGPTGLPRAAVSARTDGGAVVLSGTVPLVSDGAAADVLVVAARDGDDDLLVVADRGFAVEPRPTTDSTRRLADVRFDDVNVSADAVLARGSRAAEVVDSLWSRAGVGIALDAVGGASVALDMTVEYTRDRQQFGRPIATFQAVKHRCSDMFVSLETARVACTAAVVELAAGGDRGHYWASVAKFYAGDAYAKVAGDALQLHGGIGFTWEHDLHLWLKRAKLDQALHGSSDAHRARVTRLI